MCTHSNLNCINTSSAIISNEDESFVNNTFKCAYEIRIWRKKWTRLVVGGKTTFSSSSNIWVSRTGHILKFISRRRFVRVACSPYPVVLIENVLSAPGGELYLHVRIPGQIFSRPIHTYRRSTWGCTGCLLNASNNQWWLLRVLCWLINRECFNIFLKC